MSNRVDAVLTPAVGQEILTLLKTVETKLPPLVQLTPAQRQALPKMGVQTNDFVDAAVMLADQNPSLIPDAIDVDGLHKDADLVRALLPIRAKLAQLLEGVDDTLMEAGSEAFAASLEVYQVAKTMGKGNANIDAALKNMAQRFKKTRAAQPPQPDTK